MHNFRCLCVGFLSELLKIPNTFLSVIADFCKLENFTLYLLLFCKRLDLPKWLLVLPPQLPVSLLKFLKLVFAAWSCMFIVCFYSYTYFLHTLLSVIVSFFFFYFCYKLTTITNVECCLLLHILHTAVFGWLLVFTLSCRAGSV